MYVKCIKYHSLLSVYWLSWNSDHGIWSRGLFFAIFFPFACYWLSSSFSKNKKQKKEIFLENTTWSENSSEKGKTSPRHNKTLTMRTMFILEDLYRRLVHNITPHHSGAPNDVFLLHTLENTFPAILSTFRSLCKYIISGTIKFWPTLVYLKILLPRQRSPLYSKWLLRNLLFGVLNGNRF